ncbi:MAG: hypothetical protein V8T48_00155 [Oscillospiraceae bacterium]
MAKVTLFKFNFAGFMEIGWFTAITLIITFCIIDMFDTIGTLVGTASRAGMVEQGRYADFPEGSSAVRRHRHHRRRLHPSPPSPPSSSPLPVLRPAAHTILGPARITRLLFLACIFIAPIAAIIPAAATSAALIYVGILMLQGLKRVDSDDMDQMVPVALMLIGMPISGSIGHAIGLGLISYTIMKFGRQGQGSFRPDLRDLRSVPGEVLPGCVIKNAKMDFRPKEACFFRAVFRFLTG